MTTLRPTLRDSDKPGLSYDETYFRILQAVSESRSLIHGKLNDKDGHTCAVGSYFKQADTPINAQAIEEIAAYNDSFPKLSASKRWQRVREWLRFKVSQLENKKS